MRKEIEFGPGASLWTNQNGTACPWPSATKQCGRRYPSWGQNWQSQLTDTKQGQVVGTGRRLRSLTPVDRTSLEELQLAAFLQLVDACNVVRGLAEAAVMPRFNTNAEN
jgi:hypothetical protein